MAALYVLVQYKSQSLIEHLRQAWRTSGILPDYFITVVPPQMRFGPAWYRGTADAVLQNLNVVDDFNPDIVAIFGADHIYRMDINQMLTFHEESGADVTVAARPVPRRGRHPVRRAGDRPQRAGWSPSTRSRRRPKGMPGDPERALVSMGNYLFSRPGAGGRAAGRRPPQHRPRLRPLDHPRDGADRTRLRLRLPGQRGPGREAVRGARLLARRRHGAGVLGRPHGSARASRRASISTTAGGRSAPGQHPGPPARFIGGDVDNAHIGEASLVKRATIRNSILGPLGVGQRGRGDRGLDRHGPHHGRQGRPPASAPSSIASTSSRPTVRSAWTRPSTGDGTTSIPSGIVVVPRGGRREFLLGLEEF